MVPFVVGVAGKCFGTPTIQEMGKAFYEEEKLQYCTATEEGKVVVVMC